LEDNHRVSEHHAEKIKGLERELVQLNDSHDNLKQAVAAEIKDIERYKANRDDTWAGLVELLDRLDDELFRRIGVEYNNQTLREHIEFVKQINERELNEMAQLSTALPFNEQIEFYKDQLKRVISNIRKDYEQLHMDQTREMEEWMKMKKEELAQMYNEKDPLHDLEMNMHLENIETLRDAYDANIKEIEDLKRNHNLMAARLQQVEEHVDMERAHINDTLEAQNNEVCFCFVFCFLISLVFVLLIMLMLLFFILLIPTPFYFNFCEVPNLMNSVVNYHKIAINKFKIFFIYVIDIN
jgi:hypothetical protein